MGDAPSPEARSAASGSPGASPITQSPPPSDPSSEHRASAAAADFPDCGWPPVSAAPSSSSPTAAAAPLQRDGGIGNGSVGSPAALSGGPDGGLTPWPGTLAVLPLQLGPGSTAQAASTAQSGAARAIECNHRQCLSARQMP